MTDQVFYQEMDQLAVELLTDFGSLATLRSFTKTKPNADGKVEKVPTDTPGLAVQTLSEVVLNAMSMDTQVKLVYKGAREPQVEWHLIHAGKTWEVKEVKLAAPVGQMIVAFLGCNKP